MHALRVSQRRGYSASGAANPAELACHYAWRRNGRGMLDFRDGKLAKRVIEQSDR